MGKALGDVIGTYASGCLLSRREETPGLISQLKAVSGNQGRTKWVALVALALAASVVEVFAASLVYVLIGQVTDPNATTSLPIIGDPLRFLGNVAEDEIVYIIAAFIGFFFVVRGALLVFQKYLQARVVYNFCADLSARLATEYLRMPYGLHLRRNSAELVRNALFNVQRIGAVLSSIVKVLAESLIMVALVVTLLLITPVASLIAIFVLGPITMVLLWVVKARMRSYGRGVNDMEKVSLGVIQEGLAGIRDIKVLGAERWFSRTFRTARVRQARYDIKYAALGEVPRVMVETLLVLTIAGFFVLVTAVPTFGNATLSTVGLFAYVGMRLKPSIQAIISGVNEARNKMPSLTDVSSDLLTLTRAEQTLPQGANALKALPRLEHHIRLDQVSYSYEGTNSRSAVTNITIEIQKGEAVGIVGPTGSGKSTLIDIVTGLIEPTHGTVEVDGFDVHSGDILTWYQQLGVVSQVIFMMDATVRENIALGIPRDRVDDAAMNEAIRLAQLQEVVAELPQGLDTPLGERGVRLSGGQRQRVAIARALYRTPEVLILDEGTASLDNQTEAELVEALRQLQGNITLLIVAHRLSTVRYCDRVLVVDSGRIVETGSFQSLLQSHPMFETLRTGSASSTS